VENFLSNLEPVGFSGITLLYEVSEGSVCWYFFTDVSGLHIGPVLMDPANQEISSRNSTRIQRFSVVDSRVLPSADGPTAQ
jgi:hypothetical protein